MINISHLKIIAIGKVRKEWIKSGIEQYMKRLPGLILTEIKDSNKEKETQAIKKILRSNDLLISLAEEGKLYTSMELANKLEQLSCENLNFVIGGADGLSHEVKKNSNFQLSLSPLTFPHEIARLLLIEQIYRALMISKGTPYHRD